MLTLPFYVGGLILYPLIVDRAAETIAV